MASVIRPLNTNKMKTLFNIFNSNYFHSITNNICEKSYEKTMNSISQEIEEHTPERSQNSSKIVPGRGRHKKKNVLVR